MLHKSCHVQVKAAGESDGLAEGQFEAIVSVFGNKDSYGDIVIPGAFTDTLADWAKSGDPIPVYWSHRMDDPDYNIGEVLEATQTDVGLQVKVQMDMDSPKAPQVYRLLKGRRVTQFSFAYEVTEGALVETVLDDGTSDYSYEIRAAKLYEVGPTPIGANQETELLGVKTVPATMRHVLTEVKAGRVLAGKHIDSLRAAQEAIGTVIEAAEANLQDDEEKASTSEPPAPDVPDQDEEKAMHDVSAKNLSTHIEFLRALQF